MKYHTARNTILNVFLGPKENTLIDWSQPLKTEMKSLHNCLKVFIPIQ